MLLLEKIGVIGIKKEFIFLDIANSISLYWNVEISKHKDGFAVLVHTGKIGNKGSQSISYTSKSYKDCKVYMMNKCREKSRLGYRDIRDVACIINDLFGLKSNICDKCGCFIKDEMYCKINDYLRNETTIDDNLEYSGKVICIACQKKIGVKRKEKQSV